MSNAYEAPSLEVIGSLKDLTLQGQGGNNPPGNPGKRGTEPDGQSGINDKQSNGGGGGGGLS